MLRSIRLRRGRPRAPPLHARPRPRRRGREGRPQDEVALRRAARAALARRAACCTRAPASSRRSRASSSSARTSAAREDYYRLGVGLIGAEAMLRLFTEQEANERAFKALTRFLDLLDERRAAAERPALDPLGLSFQLKLLWLSRLPAAPDELRRVRRRRRDARRLLAARRRRRLPRLRAAGGRARAVSRRGDRRDRGAAREPARRRDGRSG